MEALRSAEALQVHWDAAHSNSGAAAAEPVQVPAAINQSPSSVDPSLADGVYAPQLPAEGCDDELMEYKTLVSKMTETINVSSPAQRCCWQACITTLCRMKELLFWR